MSETLPIPTHTINSIAAIAVTLEALLPEVVSENAKSQQHRNIDAALNALYEAIDLLR
jgi:hypothetical protein